MKSIVLVAAAVVGLCSGCAIDGRNHGMDDVDQQKVASIDRVGRARGLEIHWVNLPQRRAGSPVVVEPILPTGT